MGYLCTRKAQYAPSGRNMHHGAQGRLYFFKNSGDPDDFLFWWFTEKIAIWCHVMSWHDNTARRLGIIWRLWVRILTRRAWRGRTAFTKVFSLCVIRPYLTYCHQIPETLYFWGTPILIKYWDYHSSLGICVISPSIQIFIISSIYETNIKPSWCKKDFSPGFPFLPIF